MTTSSLGLAGTEYSANGAPFRSNTLPFGRGPSDEPRRETMVLRSLVIRWGWMAFWNTGSSPITSVRNTACRWAARWCWSARAGRTSFTAMPLNSCATATWTRGITSICLRRHIGHRLPEFRRNNFGGALGGPIKKNKTFFFGVYEELSQALGTTNTATFCRPVVMAPQARSLRRRRVPQISLSTGDDCAANGAARLRSIRFPTSG